MSEIYVKDIGKDEIRSGFLVTTDRKKIWNKEIELLLEIDRICKKYDIKYFALFGTLLGAVRHKGFIPWDDDIDLAMMRPDYMRFVEIAAKEIKKPYFLQNTYTDNRIMNWSKLMDDTTSAIENWDAVDMHQGLFVDIFPLDVVSDGTERASAIDGILKELWMCVIMPQKVAEGLKDGKSTYVASTALERIIEMPLAGRMSVYEDFCLKHYDESSVFAFQPAFWCGDAGKYDKKSFNQISYMNFETVEIPVPQDYETILNKDYPDWRIPKHTASNHEGIVMSADIPHDVMLKNINRQLLDCVDFYWEA